MHALATVIGEMGAGDERRFIGSEVDDEPGHFLRLAQTHHRNLRQDLRVQHLLGE